MVNSLGETRENIFCTVSYETLGDHPTAQSTSVSFSDDVIHLVNFDDGFDLLQPEVCDDDGFGCFYGSFIFFYVPVYSAHEPNLGDCQIHLPLQGFLDISGLS